MLLHFAEMRLVHVAFECFVNFKNFRSSLMHAWPLEGSFPSRVCVKIPNQVFRKLIQSDFKFDKNSLLFNLLSFYFLKLCQLIDLYMYLITSSHILISFYSNCVFQYVHCRLILLPELFENLGWLPQKYTNFLFSFTMRYPCIWRFELRVRGDILSNSE